MSRIEPALLAETPLEALSLALTGLEADDVAAPIRAGMRARAVADACEQLGLAAVLIDQLGRVLHVGRLAAPLLGGRVAVLADHLVGRTPAARRAVQAAVAEALQGAVPPPRSRSLTGLRYRDGSPVQRLAGLVIVGPLDREGRRRMAALRDLLAAARFSAADSA